MIENSTDTSDQKESIALKSDIDIFYGMLMSPIETFKVLSHQYSAQLPSLVGPALIVTLAALADAATSFNSSSGAVSAMALSLFGSFIGKMFFWFVLVFFLRLLAAFLKEQTSIRICCLVTGWAFVPIIFKSITTCFSNATELGDILSWCLSIWFLLLQLFAFDSVLKLGRFKTLGVILILPPCLFFAYFICMIFAGVMLSDGFF
jgi:hypothetical protein